MTDENGKDKEIERKSNRLLLDLTQLILDIVGIFEPTPFADSTNAMISLGRKDFLGAGLSAISVLPYIGDLVKLGKLSRYCRSVNQAISLAESNAKFASQLRPLLLKLKKLLDDVPADQLPGGLGQIRQRINGFLKGTPPSTGALTKAMQKLPSGLRTGFLRAMKLPPLRHPRPLRKRPGPVDEDSLLRELANKGFIRVKSGRHSPQKINEKRRAVEDSDIYVRRVVGDGGKEYFETVRVDRKFGGGTTRPYGKTREGLTPSPGASGGVMSPGDVQRADQQFRRLHHTLRSTSAKAGRAQGGRQAMSNSGRRRMVNELQAGSKKGEFSHWHRERIPANPEDLARYLTRPLKGKTDKYDNMGQWVGTW
jgi:hypothetical protein